MHEDPKERSTTGTTTTDALKLHQNQPNPFDGETTIGFYLPEAGAAILSIFSEAGQLLYTLKGEYAKGENSVSISEDLLGAKSGLYYYRLSTATESATRKMILTNR